MHELAVAQSILDIVEEKAASANASRIARINLVLGEWSGMVDDCMQFYFDFLGKGTLADGALLSFRRIPARFLCRSCRAEFEADQDNWDCPKCGSLGGELTAGREFYVESIEVE